MQVRELTSNFGGTELMGPLKAVLSKPVQNGMLSEVLRACIWAYHCISFSGIPRQLFILTDGDVENVEECVDYVKYHASMFHIILLFYPLSCYLQTLLAFSLLGSEMYEPLFILSRILTPYSTG
jgi:hypothetical protein